MTDRLRLALAQLNPRLGAVAANASRIRAARAEAAAMGAALLVTPAPQARRTTEVTLLLTALDAAAVWTARAEGDVARRSAVLSGVVLALSSYGAARWHRR